MAEIQFGEIDGVSEGQLFKDRKALSAAGVHRPLQAGIDGNGRKGSSSIVLNGGYVDDEDHGDLIIYTGHGGNDPNTKKQVADQSWDAPGNKGLVTSEMHGKPVRITRGPSHKSKYNSRAGYEYGGLYQVTSHYYEKGKDGFGICRFVLEKISSIVANSIEVNEPNNEYRSGETTRMVTTILRIVRDTKLSREVKELYDFTCQICGLRIEFNGVGYAEAAHIKPLGRPHHGKDLLNNLLCLCPNHHVMFDKGHFSIHDDLSCVGLEAEVGLSKDHKLDLSNLKYHREHHNW